MSYCRFSEGDLYIIRTLQGYELFTANYKRMRNALKSCDDLLRASSDQVPISLPQAGQHFFFNSLEELRLKILELKRLGYKFPKRALNRVNAEIKSGQLKATKARRTAKSS